MKMVEKITSILRCPRSTSETPRGKLMQSYPRVISVNRENYISLFHLAPNSHFSFIIHALPVNVLTHYRPKCPKPFGYFK